MAAANGDGPNGKAPAADSLANETNIYNFQIIKEELLHSRYLNVFNRVVEHPPRASDGQLSSSASRTIEYDIVAARTQSCHFCCVFPFHTASQQVTLLYEYAQGPNQMAYTVPCGGVSPSHTSLEDCVRKELSEEAMLHGGRLVKLVPDSHPGLLEVKWAKNRFTPFLVIDPELDPHPRPQDVEEFIEVLQVDVPTLRRHMAGSDMMLPSIVTCNMALDYLQSNGYL